MIRDLCPGRGHDPSTIVEHASDLAQRGNPIREELQALLDQRQVERGVRKRQRGGVAFTPLDFNTLPCRSSTGNRDHGRTDINSDHGCLTGELVGHHSRHDPGPAGDIENPFTSLRCGYGLFDRLPCSIRRLWRRNAVATALETWWLKFGLR